MIADDAGILFDDEIVKIFIENVILYPIGTKVLLSTNEIGIVIHERESEMELLTIAIVTGKRKRWVKLSKNSNIFIEKVILI